MNNDLISREALKHEFARITYVRWTADMGQGGYDNFALEEIVKIIDRAPTVEPLERIGSICDENCGYHRPQGEWKDHSEDGYVECPFCGHLTNCEDNIDELHYCWNCGAKMKGGAEND